VREPRVVPGSGQSTIAWYFLYRYFGIFAEVLIDDEQLETTPEHPFFTAEKGWLPAGELTIGMHVRRADGTYGLVWWAWAVHRIQTMYNLTVGTAHTFYVGQGQWLVHNSGNDGLGIK
jgi:hypothetical protein